MPLFAKEPTFKHKDQNLLYFELTQTHNLIY